jgi:hypothetical protein
MEVLVYGFYRFRGSEKDVVVMVRYLETILLQLRERLHQYCNLTKVLCPSQYYSSNIYSK